MSLSNSELLNVLQEVNPSKDNSYAKITWIKELIDTNNGNYNNGLVNFSTQAYKSKWIDYRAGYLMVPLIIHGKNNVFAQAVGSAPRVALKNGIAQLIYSLKMQINNVIVQNTENLNQYNAILQMVDDSIDWQASHGTLYHLAKDNVDSNSVEPYVYTATQMAVLNSDPGTNVASTQVVPAATASSTAFLTDLKVAKNPLYNEGFEKRVSFVEQYYRHGAASQGYWSFKAIIPLKLISGFFKQLDSPLYNVHFNFQFGITSLVPSSNALPVMANTNEPLSILIGAPPNVIAPYGQPFIPAGGETSCRLYLPEIQWKPEIEAGLMKLLDSGLPVTTTFYDVKKFENTKPTSPQDANISQVITTGIVKPQRVWVVGVPQASSASHQSPSPCQSTLTLTDANILINLKKQFDNNITEPYEFYQMLQKEMYNAGEDNQTGSLIGYNDFQNPSGNHRYYCFNISKQINSMANTLEPVDLSFQGRLVKAAGDDLDVAFFVETETTVVINMSTSTITTFNN
jgi:hypothetical protein